MRMIDSMVTKSSTKTMSNQTISIYDIEMKTLEGNTLKFSEFRGKNILVVNVASKCGFTGQYKSLQALSEKYKEDLIVIGTPCNQFGKQEPGNATAIRSFCNIRYGVSFPLTEKIEVKGPGQHLLYQWLTKKTLNGRKNATVRWNFQKYLVDKEGNLVDVFYSTTSPLSHKITQHL
ncbi:MAG: glutathione peroxidase [Flavobacteriaceae bacterium]